eukprot:UN03203
MKDFGVQVRCILCCVRSMPIWSWQVLELCKNFKSSEELPLDLNGLCVGIGLIGSDEVNFPNKLHRPIFYRARKLRIMRSITAGESGGEGSILSAFQLVHAVRIAAGYRATERKAVWIRICKPQTPVEVAPTHSIRVACPQWDGNWSTHPLQKFREDEAKYCFTTHSPAVLGITLESEIRLAEERFGFTKEMIATSMTNSARSSFLDENEKNDLLLRIRKRWERQMRHLTEEFSGVHET